MILIFGRFCVFGFILITLKPVNAAVFERHLSSFDDRKMTDGSKLLEPTNAGSLSACSEFCVQQTACVSYHYNTLNGKCQIYPILFDDHNDASLTFELGWTYYQVFDNENCYNSPGYIQQRQLGLCYKFRNDPDSLNVTEFQQLCAADNAELIAIRSKEIQDHVMQYLGQLEQGIILIQGNDLDQDGIWTYDDGSEMEYTNWKPDHPKVGGLYTFPFKSDNYMWWSGAAYYGAPGGFVCNKLL